MEIWNFSTFGLGCLRHMWLKHNATRADLQRRLVDAGVSEGAEGGVYDI